LAGIFLGGVRDVPAAWAPAVAIDEGVGPGDAPSVVASKEARAMLGQSLYQRYLHRSPDLTGLASWVKFLKRRGSSDEQALAGIFAQWSGTPGIDGVSRRDLRAAGEADPRCARKSPNAPRTASREA